MATKHLLKLTLTCLLFVITVTSNSQVTTPHKIDSSLENSDYDISKAIYRYYKQNPAPIKISELQKKLFDFKNQNFNDPITIGLIYSALKGIISDLEATARTVSGDIASHLNNLMGTANAVLAHWDTRLADRLDRTIQQLNDLERRIVEDTENLIRMMQETIRQVQARAIETAIVTAGEANILAYDITSIIMRNKNARFVYSTPQSIRIGLNEPIVKIKGNFLCCKSYNFRLSGYNKEIVPISFSDNEVTIKLPDDFISTVDKETTISLSAQPYSHRKRLLWFGRKYWKAEPQSKTIVLKPKIDYSIAVSITPKAKLPTEHTFEFAFHDIDDNCDADRRIDRTYVLPPGWYLKDLTQKPDLRNTSGPNCCSGLIGRGAYNSGDNSVIVEGRICGCGYDGVWPVRFCRARGWWGYVLFVPAKSYQYQPIPIYEQQVSVPNQSQRSFTFDYPQTNIPADNQGVQFLYTIVIQIQEGSTTRRVEISDVNPNVEGFRTRMNNNRLTLEIDPATKVLEFK